MTTQDDIKQEAMPEGVDATVMEEYDHWCKVERIARQVVVDIIFGFLWLGGLPCYMAACGLIKPNKLLWFIALSVLGFSLFIWLPMFISNFKPSKPVRIMREAIWLFAIFCAAIVLQCWSACLFGGGGMESHFTFLRIALLGGASVSALQYFLLRRPELAKRGVLKFLNKILNTRLRFKIGRDKKIDREKKMKQMQNWLGRRVDAFVRNHPSLILSSEKEFAVLEARYMTWAAMLFVLALEAYLFARRFFA